MAVRITGPPESAFVTVAACETYYAGTGAVISIADAIKTARIRITEVVRAVWVSDVTRNAGIAEVACVTLLTIT